jgi:uncharacterized membrane protein
MSLYLALKLIHILTATLLLGTGLGIAYFMWSAHRSRNLEALRVTTRHVVRADWLFTAPAVVLQLVTGVWLMAALGFRFDSAWFHVVIALYLVAGACWVPVVFIQYGLRAVAERTARWEDLSPGYQRLFRWWMGLGVPAFAAVIALFGLMVFKPWL